MREGITCDISEELQRKEPQRKAPHRHHTGPQAEDNSSPQDAQAAAPSLDLTIAAGTTYR